MKNFIKIFCDHHPHSMQKEIETFCEDNNVEPLHTSSSYSEADYLTVVVTFKHCEDETLKNKTVSERRFIGSGTCHQCGGQMEKIWDKFVCKHCKEVKETSNRHPDYVTISSGNGGYFAMYLKWNAEIDTYEPWNTSEPFKSFEYAVRYAKEWAEGEGVEYKEA